MATITAPITVSKVSTTIGRASLDVGTLCSAGSTYINKWAKYKPIRYTGADPLTDAEFANSNYGFNISTTSLNNNAEYAFENREADWEYLAPTTGYYYRLTDFNGYNSEAIRPYNVSFTAEAGEMNEYNAYVHVMASLATGTNAEISLTDLGIFANSAPGAHWAILYKYTGNSYLQIDGYDPDSVAYDSYLYPLEDDLNVYIEIPDVTGSKQVDICVVLLSEGEAIYTLPEAYASLSVTNQTFSSYWGLGVTPTAYYSGSYGSHQIYSSINIVNSGTVSRSISWTYIISVYGSSSTVAENTITYSGTTTVAIGSYTTLKPGSSTSGDYGVVAAYSGSPIDISSVSYTLTVKVDGSSSNQLSYTGNIEYQS